MCAILAFCPRLCCLCYFTVMNASHNSTKPFIALIPGRYHCYHSLIVGTFFQFSLPWVPEVFFSVSWEGKKTSGNSGQLADIILDLLFDCVAQARASFSLKVLFWYLIKYHEFYKLKIFTYSYFVENKQFSIAVELQHLTWMTSLHLARFTGLFPTMSSPHIGTF